MEGIDPLTNSNLNRNPFDFSKKSASTKVKNTTATSAKEAPSGDMRASYLKDANQAKKFAKRSGGESSRTKPLQKTKIEE